MARIMRPDIDHPWIGRVYKLKSGGPALTVTAVYVDADEGEEPCSVVLTWFDNIGHLHNVDECNLRALSLVAPDPTVAARQCFNCGDPSGSDEFCSLACRSRSIVTAADGSCWDRCPNHDGKRCDRLGHRAPEGVPCPVQS